MLSDLNSVDKKGFHLSFQAGDSLGYLGPQIESYNASQIAALGSYVPTRFTGSLPPSRDLFRLSPCPSGQIQMPYPQFTSFSGTDPMIANAIYNGLQVKVEKGFSHGRLPAEVKFAEATQPALFIPER